MLRLIRLYILLAVIFPAIPLHAADDWKMWNTYGFKLPLIRDKMNLNFSMDTRFREDMDEFYRYHFYVGPDYQLLKWLTSGVQYGNIQEGDPGEFHTEHRVMFFLTPKFKLADLCMKDSPISNLTLTVQNRLDWRIRYFKDHVNTWRYRVYPKLSYPLFKSKHLTLSPYMADAFYFDFTDNIAFNHNRVYAGLNTKLFKNINMDWYYMRLAERSGSGGPWTCSNVIGTGVSYEF